jgi:hypothetical protein
VEPTLALGALAARDSTRFPNERFGLTSVTPISAHLGARLTNFVAKNRISALRLAKIDRSRFTIPPDFTEVPRSSASAMPPQNTAKWRAWP